jgi:elongation factor P
VINASEMKKGMAVKFDGDLYIVVDYELVKPGKGPAYLVTTVKNLKSGAVTIKRLQGADKIEDVFIEKNDAEYLYRDGTHFVFMDTKSYEQIFISDKLVGEGVNFLVSNMKVNIVSCEGVTLGVELPPAVELKIVETEPSLRGATLTNKNKPAIVETGYKVMVPSFVEPGTVIRVDTRSGQYLERAK